MEETFTVEEQQYVNPNVSVQETQDFISNLRGLQAENNAQIARDTHNLGTDVTSNLGGLTGAEGTFQARYQTPQVNALAANLDMTSRQTALNTALNNRLNMYKNRYNEAQRSYKRKASKASRRSRTGGDYPLANTPSTSNDPDIEYQPTSGSGVGTITALPGESVVASPYTGDDGNPINLVMNSDGKVVRLDGVVTEGSSVYNTLKKLYPELV